MQSDVLELVWWEYVVRLIFFVAQEAKQYISQYETGGEAAREKEERRWQTFGRSFVKRKLGLQGPKRANPPRVAKRRRVKSFLTGMQIDNMLRGSTDTTLADYVIQPDASGSLPSPWVWRSLNLSPDMGPDMVCLYHFLAYDKLLNINADFDLSHASQNSSKAALKSAKLWTRQVLMVVAANCVCGSTLSPPRLQQIRECVEEFFDTASPSDPFFQYHLPYLVEQLKLGIALTDLNVDQVV